MENAKKKLSSKQQEELLATLKARFEKNLARHEGVAWAKVQARLEANPEKLWSLSEMERTGGEPDVVDQDTNTGEYVFYLFPSGRTQAPRRTNWTPPRSCGARRQRKGNSSVAVPRPLL